MSETDTPDDNQISDDDWAAFAPTIDYVSLGAGAGAGANCGNAGIAIGDPCSICGTPFGPGTTGIGTIGGVCIPAFGTTTKM